MRKALFLAMALLMTQSMAPAEAQPVAPGGPQGGTEQEWKAELDRAVETLNEGSRKRQPELLLKAGEAAERVAAVAGRNPTALRAYNIQARAFLVKADAHWGEGGYYPTYEADYEIAKVALMKAKALAIELGDTEAVKEADQDIRRIGDRQTGVPPQVEE